MISRILALMVMFLVTAAVVASGGEHARAEAAGVVLDSLQGALKQEQKARSDYEDALRALVARFGGLKLDMDESVFESEAARNASKVQAQQKRIYENRLRLQFLDKLIGKLSDKSPLTPEVVRTTLLGMASDDLIVSTENRTLDADDKTWLFDIYLSIAIRDMYEPEESMGDFIHRFMAYSTMSDPQSPRGFIKGRNYLGGKSEAPTPSLGATGPLEGAVNNSP